MRANNRLARERRDCSWRPSLILALRPHYTHDRIKAQSGSFNLPAEIVRPSHAWQQFEGLGDLGEEFCHQQKVSPGANQNCADSRVNRQGGMRVTVAVGAPLGPDR
jgi:hypothetical protein